MGRCAETEKLQQGCGKSVCIYLNFMIDVIDGIINGGFGWDMSVSSGSFLTISFFEMELSAQVAAGTCCSIVTVTIMLAINYMQRK